jgi:hypothetical protein
MNQYSYFGDPDFSSDYYISKWERRGTPPNFKKYLAVGAAVGAGLGVLDVYSKKRMAKKLLEQEFGQER